MHSNNEVGSVQPIAEIVAVCRPRGIKVHADGAQSTGARAGNGATGIESMSCVCSGGESGDGGKSFFRCVRADTS